MTGTKAGRQDTPPAKQNATGAPDPGDTPTGDTPAFYVAAQDIPGPRSEESGVAPVFAYRAGDRVSPHKVGTIVPRDMVRDPNEKE